MPRCARDFHICYGFAIGEIAVKCVGRTAKVVEVTELGCNMSTTKKLDRSLGIFLVRGGVINLRASAKGIWPKVDGDSFWPASFGV
jgi:hypothetical protein